MTTAIARLLAVVGGGGSFPAVARLPDSWGVSREASNPVIDVTDNPSETVEQYVPHGVRLPNGDVWVYVKGTSVIYAWKSTDGGVTFSLQNGGSPVIGHGAGGSWDSHFVLEPVAFYDEGSDTVRLWYKGSQAAGTDWQIGYATAPGSDPANVTKYGGNPIITSNTIESQLGTSNITDLAISDVVIDGSDYHFYCYALWGSVYHIIHMTGTTWTDPVADAVLLTGVAAVSATVETPSVFQFPGEGPLYGMFYAVGPSAISLVGLEIRFAWSTDLETGWDFSDTTAIMSPLGGASWEASATYACSLLKGGADHLTPLYDSLGRWLFYYSGYRSSTGKASSGLAYLTPG